MIQQPDEHLAEAERLALLIARKRPRFGYALATCYLAFLCYAVFGTPYFR
jgi:hypothetical protein